MTEYTGLRYAFFMLAEYAGMVVLSAIAVALYLGGWYVWPGLSYETLFGFVGLSNPPTLLVSLVAFGVTMGKVLSLVFVMVWFRATFPRLREDQLQRFAWLFLIPLAILQIIVVAIAKVFS
jgi:NADH-quinone oxidoreductase subunit H